MDIAAKQDGEFLRKVFDRTDGHCHLCGKKLAWKNYAQPGTRGTWEVEHSVPQVAGGTDRLNNLYPACISCNRSKGAESTKSVRARNGRTRAPYSREKKDEIRGRNTILGGLIGLLVGAVLIGRVGALIGFPLVAWIGNSLDPGA